MKKNKKIKFLKAAILTTALILLLVLISNVQSDTEDYSLQWKNEYPHDKIQEVRDGCITLDGNEYLTVGRTWTLSTSKKPFQLKVDSQGNEQWYTEYGQWSRYDAAWCVTPTSDEGFVMGGKVEYSGSYDDILVFKTDSLGNFLWRKDHDIGGYFDRMWDIMELDDGSLIGCGTVSPTSATYHDAGLIKMNAQGDMSWYKSYGPLGSTEVARTFCKTSDGGYIIAGYYGFNQVHSKSQLYIIKTDAQGNEQWSKIYGDANVWNNVEWIAETSDNCYLLTGESGSANDGLNGIVIKLSQSGDILWQQTIGGQYDDMLLDGVLTNNGGCIVVGFTQSFSSDPSSNRNSRDSWIIQLNSQGEILINETVGSPGKADQLGDINGPAADGSYFCGGTIGYMSMVWTDANPYLLKITIDAPLIAYWSFDEGTGTIAYDSSGNNNDGTIYGAQWTQETLDGEGYALDFDGVDDRVTVANDPSLNVENEVTVEAWIKPNSFKSPSTGLWNCVVSKDAGSGPTGEWTWILLAGYTDTEKGRLSFQIRGENGATGPQTDPIIPKDQWSHIVGVYDGSHLSMYLNGESVFTAPVSVGPLYNCNIPLEIGYDQDKPDSDYFAFDGMIDEVQVYNMALSADEILSHYNSRNKCIGFYHMDEGSGTTAYDSSGNGNHGTLTNMDINICWVDGILDSSALLFDGVDDCVEVDTLNIDQSATSNGVSMEAWVYPTSISSGRHQIISSDDGGYDWSILREGGNWHVFTGENSRNTGFSVDINKWQHIAAVFIPGIGVNFYKNGVKTSIPYISYDSSDNPICIADNPGSWQEFFTGRIDEVGIYSRALSEEEIIGHYNKIKECRGLWLINEGSGTITYDGSGNDNDGTIYGAQWTQETLDGEGYALDFDGVDDYVDCGNDVSLNPSNAITIEAWVYPRSFQTEWPYIRGIAQKSLYGMSSGYLLRFGDAGLANNKIQFMINNLKLNGNREHTVNCWYHIVATYDGTVMKLYSNGQLDGSTPYSGSIIPTNDLLIIGRDAGQGGNRNFDGKIDEVRLYNYALSEEEILNHFNSKYQYIGLWHMDEGSGTTAYDSSGNGNHGTLTNMDISTCWVQGVSNTALNFDGTNDYVDCGNNDMFNMGYDGVTLEAWIYKTTGGGYQGIGYDGIITIDRVPGKYSGYILALVALVDDKYEIEIAFGDGIGGGSLHRRSKISPPIIEPNTWYHVVGVINGPNNMSIYVNGEDVGGTYSGSATSVGWLGGPCVIGNKWAGDRYFKGKIDEVGIYKRALSADEVFSNYIRYQPPINPLPKIKEIL